MRIPEQLLRSSILNYDPVSHKYNTVSHFPGKPHLKQQFLLCFFINPPNSFIIFPVKKQVPMYICFTVLLHTQKAAMEFIWLHCRFLISRLQPLLKFILWQGLVKHISLYYITAKLFQIVKLLSCLNTLRN